MKKIYKKNWLFNTKALATVCIMLFTGGAAMAQLSGTYTIDTSAVSSLSAKNFSSFNDLADSLETYGVSGAVTVNVLAGQGTFNETVTFNAIFNASSTNTITINGNGNTLSNSSGYVVNVNGADYLTFDNLIVENTGTNSSTRVFWVHNNSDGLTISNCELIVSSNSGSGSGSGYVYFSNSSSGRSSGSHSKDYTIKDNVMWGGSASATSAVYYGIIDYRSSSYYGSAINATVTGNTIKHFYYAGAYYYYTNTLTFTRNTIADNKYTSGYIYGFYMYRANGIQHIDSNTIENLESNGFYHYGMYIYYADATSGVSTAKNNTLKNLANSYYYAYGMYYRYADNWEVTDNVIDAVSSTYQYGYGYGIYAYYIDDAHFDRNTVKGIEGGYGGYGMMLYYNSNGSADDNWIEGVKGNYYYSYGMYIYRFSNATVERNTLKGIENSSSFGYGYVYGMYAYYSNDVSFANNMIYDLKAAGYYMYAMRFYWYGSGYTGNKIANNTIRVNNKPGNQLGNSSAIYYDHRSQPEIPAADIVNNMIYIDDDNTTYTSVGIWVTNGEPMIDNNNIFAPATMAVYYGAYGTTAYNTLPAWQNASNGQNEMSIDPEFADVANYDYTPSSVNMANRGLKDIVTDDYNKDPRPSCGVDVGAIEYYTDFSASNFTLSGADRCGNTSDEITFDLTNGYTDDRITLDVYYTLNGSQVDETSDTIHANSTTTYTFNDMPVYHEPGVNTVTVGIFCDDNEANNSLTQTFTVIASPSGGDITEGSTFEGYFNGGTMEDPDIAVPNTTSVYDITGPTKYSGGYGTDWEVVNNSMTAGGMVVDDVLGFEIDEANGIDVTVNPDSSLVDSMIYVSFAIKDLNTGCDSIVGRWMYIPFTPDVQFDINNVCLGSVAKFKNRSDMGGSDFMIYKWRYNDPNSNEDTSEIKDGFWDYSTYGTFDVELEVRNQSYPKFVYSLTKSITVTPTPETDFSIKNACEGIAIEFTDGTTSPVSGAITYKWNFGDGNTSTVQNPTHTYAGPVAEGYPVTMTATQNGCAATVTKTAYQFAKPVANFSAEGACNLEEVEFTNGTTIAIGKTGYTWDFGDNGVSTLADPKHVYSTAGTHSVTLKAYSEFGCFDEVTIDVELLESPEADFTFEETCNLTPVDFTFSGTAPSGVSSSYNWDFNSEATGSGLNTSHLFSEVGTKTVTLNVSSANGCSSEITKELDVVLQAVANFEVADLCEGEEAVFTNKSTVAAGDLTYTWLFGEEDVNGSSTSNFVSPRHEYKTTGNTRLVNVTLIAEVAGGCNAEITKAVTINAAPDASFNADVQGRDLIITGVDQSHTVYQWRFGDGGRSTDAVPAWTYDNVDQGSFEVCLSVKNDNCWSEECVTVLVDLAGIEGLTEDNSMINVYPNPTAGSFNLEVENASDNVTIVVADVLGNTLDITVTDNLNGKYIVDLSNVADGVYFVQVKNGDYFATKRITVSK